MWIKLLSLLLLCFLTKDVTSQVCDSTPAMEACVNTFNTAFMALSSTLQTITADNIVEVCAEVLPPLTTAYTTLSDCLDSVVAADSNCAATALLHTQAAEPNKNMISSSCGSGSVISPGPGPGPGPVPSSPSGCDPTAAMAMDECDTAYKNVVMTLSLATNPTSCTTLTAAKTQLTTCLDYVVGMDVNCTAKKEFLLAAIASDVEVASSVRICACEGGIVGQLNAMTTCINNLSSPPAVYSYDTVCGLIGGYVSCLDATVTSCPAFLEVAESVMGDLRLVEALFGCSVTVAGNTYTPDGVCNYQRMTSCYNPLLKAAGKPEFSSATNWQTFEASLGSLEVAAALLCIQLPDYQKMIECVHNEFEECPRDTYLTDQLTIYPWGTWKWNRTMNAEPARPRLADVIPRATSLVSIEKLFRGATIAYTVHAKAQTMPLVCHIGCLDYTSRMAAYAQCELLNTTDLNYDLESVLAQYKTGYQTRPTAACGKLEFARDCTTTNMKGCPLAEWQVTTVIHSAALYAAMSICGLEFDFPLRNSVELCSIPELVSNELEQTPERCQATMISGYDFYTELQSSADLCVAYQEQAYCYTQNSRCCSSKKQLLAPMMHTWAMINQKLPDCNIDVSTSTDTTDRLYVQPLASAISGGESCDYTEVFTCYADMLSMVSLTPAMLSTLTPGSLSKIYSIKDMILLDTSKCPTQSKFTEMESCLRTFAQKCQFPELCDTGSVPTTWNKLPLAEIFLTDVWESCSEQCKDTPPTMRIGLDCYKMGESDNPNMWSNEVIWNKYKGHTSTQQCSSLQSIVDCINPKVGNCEYKAEAIAREIGGPQSVIHRALDECDIEIESAEPTTTPITTGAQNNTPGAILLIMTIATVMLIHI